MTMLNGKAYLDEFDCKDYLQLFYSSYGEGIPTKEDELYFEQKQIYDFYTKYSSKWDNKTAKLLEFGGGPVITPLISAVPYIDQITFAAYAESERKEIELWKYEKEGAHDWSSYIRYVVNQVEQAAGDDAAWRERERLLRKCISSVVACDIFCANPLLINKQESFEIVSTNYCLEVACTTYIEYKEAVKKLVGLLKPGGFLLIRSDERATFYMVGGKKWYCLYLTLEQVKEALIEAGTTILMAERDPTSMQEIQNPTKADYKALLFVAAQKVEF